MKSTIVQLNKKPNLFYLTKLLAYNLNITSSLEILSLISLYNLFKNNPIILNNKSQQIIKAGIIQIIQENTDNQQLKLKEPSESSLNMAIWKLVKKKALIKIDSYYVLNPMFKELDLVEQLVFRFK